MIEHETLCVSLFRKIHHCSSINMSIACKNKNNYEQFSSSVDSVILQGCHEYFFRCNPSSHADNFLFCKPSSFLYQKKKT